MRSSRRPGAATARGFYATATAEARAVLAGGVDLSAPDATRAYYARLYRDVDTDALRIQSSRRRFDYPTVAARFRVIDDDAAAVIVSDYERQEWVCQRVEDLAQGRADPRRTLRQLQPYIVSVYRNRIRPLQQRGLLSEIVPGLYLWHGQYDRVRGIVAAAADPARFVI